MKFTRLKEMRLNQQDDKPKVKPDSKSNKKWTPEEESLLWSYYKKGYSEKGIASIMGRSYYGVVDRLSKLKKEKL